MQINISIPLSNIFITNYKIEHFNTNFQEEDVNNQILENLDLQRKIAIDIVNSIRREKPKGLFKQLDSLYDVIDDVDNSGFIQISISNKDDVYEDILTDLENSIITDLERNVEFRKEISKEIIEAIRN